ncbi:unnamed protein product [Clavelina lepadiformis]|uniref:H-type lectin domain-containing protein n=2 Tax=Clavelina lepadiformis TaxID=159417 RepID=A0ABP0F937_CLALP
MLSYTVQGQTVDPAQDSRRLSGSKSNTLNWHIEFPIPYKSKPTVNAWARGDPSYPDRFEVKINSVNSNGFMFSVRRLDQGKGWKQSPMLYWSVKGDKISNSKESRRLSGSGSHTLGWRIQFPVPYQVAPKVQAWVIGEQKYPDRFSVKVSSINTNGFDLTVTRLDQNKGWKQSPTLYWDVEGDPAVTSSESRVVSGSRSNTLNWRVQFPTPYKTQPKIFTWVRGDLKYPDRFTVNVNSIDREGYDVSIRRIDQGKGWKQKPRIFWSATGADKLKADGHEQLGQSRQETLPARITFPNQLANVPDLYVWVRGNPGYPDIFNVEINKVYTYGFDVSVTRSDRFGWKQHPDLYWTVRESESDPSNEQIAIGGSKSNTKSSRVQFPTPYVLPPEVTARVEGEASYNDRFSVAISNVDEDGFDFTVRRLDQNKGWKQNPKLYWVAMGDHVSSSHESQALSPSRSDALNWQIQFPIPYKKNPTVDAWVRGDKSYPDRFRTETNNIDQNGFSIIVRRTDQHKGWTQTPTLYWATTGADHFDTKNYRVISGSGSNTLTLHVLFPLPYTKKPKTFYSWVRGYSKYPDRFSATVDSFDKEGFQVRVRRLDQGKGWKQKPKIYWSATGAENVQCQASKQLGGSGSNTLTGHANFPRPCKDDPYEVYAWMQGDIQYPDRFSVIVQGSNRNGFDYTVKRLDQNKGWKQHPKMCWIVREFPDVPSDEQEEVGSSSYNTKTMWVDFSTTYRRAPDLTLWVIGDTENPDKFKIRINGVSSNGFNITIECSNCKLGWKQNPLLYWREVEVSESTSKKYRELGWSSFDTMTSRIHFDTALERVSEIFAWVRGDPRYPDRYNAKVDSSDLTGFDITVTRLNSTRHSGQRLKVYWSTKDISQSSPRDVSKTLGTATSNTTYKIPPSIWVSSPGISETSEKVFDILGREVHLSAVPKLLKEATTGKFPIKNVTSNESLLELVIRGDSVYIDQDVTFQGLKKLSIYARSLVSNGNTLTLQAPAVCERLDISTCVRFQAGRENQDGLAGKNGIASPKVGIYVHMIKGNMSIISQASDGNKGQDGGTGNNGNDRTNESPPLSDSACREVEKSTATDYTWTQSLGGRPGPNGDAGGDGRRCGTSGSGGTSSSASVYIKYEAGKLSFTQRPGAGGTPAEHGYGGIGGKGGTGGCGVDCDCYSTCINSISCLKDNVHCTGKPTCRIRGPNGGQGATGQDGFDKYSLPDKGDSGQAEELVLRRVDSVKKWFVNDTELLNMIRRHGDSLYHRNKTDEALKVFSFIRSVADENSDLYQQVSFLINKTKQGFDYYGNTKEYAPDLDWAFLYDKTKGLLETGRSFESTYNTVMRKIENVREVQNIMHSVVTDANRKSELEVNYQLQELTNQKMLYVKAVKQLEAIMDSEMEQIKILLPQVIDEKSKERKPFNFLSFLKALVGVVFSIVKAVEKPGVEEIKDVLDGALEIAEVFENDPTCKAPSLQQAKTTLEKRLVFGSEYNEIDPETLDFSEMDVSAVPIIVQGDLAKNKGKLVQEFSCLLDETKTDLVRNMNRVLEDFFRDAGMRMTLIDRIINMDIKLKEALYNGKLLVETQAAADTRLDLTLNSNAMAVKMKFTDLLFSLYQQQEDMILHSLYELSKAYHFVSLWDFDIMDKYINNYGDRAMTTQLGSLNGMFQLQDILQTLENDRDAFLNFISSSAGPASHTFNEYWEFDQTSRPDMLKSLHENGQFNFNLELHPNDITLGGCADCYNGRLIAMHVELSGKAQPRSVPSTIYVKVSHMGNSHFLLPSRNGSGTIIRFQETPEDVDGGHVMYFKLNSPVQSRQDPSLEEKFLKPGNRFCENSNKAGDFFGGRPCKSPYASYVVTVPKGNFACSLDPNDFVSGSNCRDLDYTKFDTIRVYAKVKSWSNYAAQETFASRRVSDLSQEFSNMIL